MVEAAGRPILERVVLNLASHGFCRIFLSINHLAEMIEDHFDDGRDLGYRVGYLR